MLRLAKNIDAYIALCGETNHADIIYFHLMRIISIALLDLNLRYFSTELFLRNELFLCNDPPFLH